MAGITNNHEVPTFAELAAPATEKESSGIDQSQRSTPPERYVSAEVVAEHLDIERRQVLAMTRAGKLPAHAVNPTSIRKQWRYKLSEIDAAINVHRNANDSGVAPNATRPHNGARQSRHQKAR